MLGRGFANGVSTHSRCCFHSVQAMLHAGRALAAAPLCPQLRPQCDKVREGAPGQLSGKSSLAPETAKPGATLSLVVAAVVLWRQPRSKTWRQAGRRRALHALHAIQYCDGLVLGGRPASVWLPGSTGRSMSTYSYSFSSRKLSRSVLGLPLGSGPVVVEVPTSCKVSLGELPSTVTARGAVLVHGLLCSRLDLAHVAEALASRGFAVVAPEMDDSVSHEDAVAPGGFVGELLNREEGEARRCEVAREAVAWLQKRGAQQVGLVGHSRGGVTISQLEGNFCRVNIAGFQPPPVDPEETFSPSSRCGPMLIICGQDDEVCTRPPLSMQYVQDTVRRLLPDAQSWYPSGVGHFSVLNPNVVSQWRPLLGPAGFFAPDSKPEVSEALAERVAAFLDAEMPSKGDASGFGDFQGLGLRVSCSSLLA